jgi:protein-disulfide isomerase
LVEYGDYECPYCGKAHPIVRRIQAKMGDRLRYVFRNFPLTEIHPHAAHAAAAAEAAGAQGKFWEMHHALFVHQHNLTEDDLRQYPANICLDADRLLREVREGTHEAHIREDFRSGIRSGVNGTPTFFINGERHDEGWDEETLLAALKRRA